MFTKSQVEKLPMGFTASETGLGGNRAMRRNEAPVGVVNNRGKGSSFITLFGRAIKVRTQFIPTASGLKRIFHFELPTNDSKGKG